MCDERERLIGYVYDECDTKERKLIEAHLETCGTCREEISGLRGVRTDLLAWDVPDHGSVWTPFVKARPTPWWSQVPAWGFAAAASMMLMAGVAGAAATRFVSAAPAAPVAAPQSDLAAVERRIMDNLRSEIAAVDARVKVVSAHQSAAFDEAGMMRRVTNMLETSERRQFEAVNAVNSDLNRLTHITGAQIADLQMSVNQLKNAQPASGAGSR